MDENTTEVIENTAITDEKERTSNASNVTLNENKIRTEAAQSERQRCNDIHFAVRAAKLEETFADELINKGLTIDQARAEIFEKLAGNDTTPAIRTATQPTSVTVAGDEKENVRRAMEETPEKIHHGRNIKRFREMLDMKQEALAHSLGSDWTQRKVSLLEQKETVEPKILKEVSKALKVPVKAIENLQKKVRTPILIHLSKAVQIKAILVM